MNNEHVSKTEIRAKFKSDNIVAHYEAGLSKVTIHGFGTPALPDFETLALPDSETPGLPGSLRGSEAPGGHLIYMNVNFANNVEK